MTVSHRFRPVRAGIVNLYEYANQTFELAGGRLLLRGHNTSGKTKALELLLPFCLDGDISPRKLDPFARAAKDMRWNLVGDYTDAEQRVGYVWLEFERLTATGETERIVAGIGMRAHRQRPGVTRWYFVARNRRVGDDLSLLRGREPLARHDLLAALGDDGELLDTQAAYRERLNALVFGFAGMEQYRTMLDLMLELRRPHLSKTLDPAGVSELLAAGLPDVDEQLMRRLAAALEQLEEHARGLRRLREVRDRSRTFVDRTYRAYLQAVIRERAEALRGAETAVENASEAMRASAAARDTRLVDHDRVRAELEHAGREARRLEGEERALIVRPEWTTVAELEQLRQRVEAQQRTADACASTASDLEAAAAAEEAELITGQAAISEEAAAVEVELRDLASHAETAGIGTRFTMLADQLSSGALGGDAWRDLARELAQDWRAVLERHSGLLGEERSAAGKLEQVREAERVADERLSVATKQRDEAERAASDARERLTDQVDRWVDDLVELTLEAQELERAQERAVGGSPGATALTAAAERTRATLAEARAEARARRSTLETECAGVIATREAIEAEPDVAPREPPWGRSSRAARAGAPLWQLVDFASELDAPVRAQIEAAMEAAGLLDAWVTPDGRLLDDQLEDVALLAGPAARGRTLADVLRSVTDGPVPQDIVAGVLARVAFDDEAVNSDDDRGYAAVAASGHFRLGPLAGAASKARPEYIGAVARAEARERLIAELRAQEMELTEQLRALAASVETFDERLRQLAAEFERFPSSDEVAAALRALSIAAALVARASAELEQRRADVQLLADMHLAAQSAARDHAVDHALPTDLDERALSSRVEACVHVASGVPGLSRAQRELERRREALKMLEHRHGESVDRAVVRRGQATEERQAAERLASEHAAREGTLDADAAELREQHERVTAALDGARGLHARLGREERAADIGAREAEREAGDREQAHTDARTARETEHRRFGRLGTSAVFILALGDAAPEDYREAHDWPLTRALDVMRGLPNELLRLRTRSGELARNVMQRVQQLDRDLAEADMGAYAVQDPEGLVLVHVSEGIGERDLGTVLEALDDEIAERERVLSAEERRVFGDALVEELADHLRRQIHLVHQRVDAMNSVLQRAPTAAGKTVQLEWRPVDDEEGRLRTALSLLRQGVRYLRNDDRQALVGFFRERAQQARHEQSMGGVPEPMATTLARAFDYRQWFAFRLIEASDKGSQPLSAKRHAVGSGGEQSVLIHLPLFAASAALYGESQAPRLVMLDEALSGIDEETRERVLAATVAFDLDLVMTSHELWGTYRSVPSLAIYQLHRENGVYGVHAVPFLWDGDVLHELEQGELFVG